MDIYDLFLSPFYLLFIYSFAFFIRKKQTDKLIRKYFIPALSIKLFGSLVFSLIYEFYYKGGDTFSYFKSGRTIANVFWENPLIGLKIFFLNANEYTADTIKHTSSIFFFNAESEWVLTKIAAFVNLFTFNTYLPSSFLFATFTFLGTWKLYLFFLKFYPNLHKQLAYCIFFIPSCIFWASGILKDTIMLGAICFFIYYISKALFFKKKILKSLIIAGIMAYFIGGVKGYILSSFLPGMLIWFYLRYQSRIKTQAIRFVLKGLLALSVPLSLAFTMTFMLGQIEQSEAFKNVQNIVIGFHGDHGGRTLGHGGGEASVYVLSQMDYTPLGMLASMPEAIIVTLFRPFLWEAKKPIVLIGALESSFFIFITIYLIFGAGLFKSFKSIFSNPEVVLCLSFTIFLGFIVGLTSYNFGVLARFKTPLMPFYATSLFIIYEISKKRKRQPKKRK